MAIDIGETIQEGLERTVARNGLYFVAISFAIGVLSGLFSASAARGMPFRDGPIDPGGVPVPVQPGGPPISLGLSPGVAALFGIVFGLLTLVVALAALRTFVTDETETVQGEHFTRNMLLAVVNSFVGGIVFAVAVAVGFVLLVVPGLFLLVSLFFWNVYVAVEDENFVTAFGSSWELTRGRRLRLFLLGVVAIVVTLAINVVFGIGQAVVPGAVGFLVGQVGSAFTTVFLLATAARAWVRLVDEDGAVADAPDEGGEDREGGFEFQGSDE